QADPLPVPESITTPEKKPMPESRIFLFADLLQEEIMPPLWIVPELLCAGLIILGGKSKAGKSWFVLNLCLAIAEGRLAFGNYQCEPQKVLYISLEDQKRRLQYRTLKLENGNSNLKQNFMGAIKWSRFAPPNVTNHKGPDGFSELKQTLVLHSDIKLVVIDTWQKIRPSKRINSDDYETDYAHLSQIQELAQQHECAIMLVHHARKNAEGSNTLDALLGSTAIQGASDLIWILDRQHGNSQGTLTPAGRDIEDESEIGFSFESGTWKYLGKKSDVDLSQNQTRILQLLEDRRTPLSFSEIERDSGVKRGSITRAIGSLEENGLVAKDRFSKKYRYVETPETCRQC
ncbi:MAG: AAA family ATPase, partial [Desulfomonilaceae bacterium]